MKTNMGKCKVLLGATELESNFSGQSPMKGNEDVEVLKNTSYEEWL